MAVEVGGAKLRSAFIVGAPRCGTTFLSKALAGHPHVCFSKPKETHFFVASWPLIEPERRTREYLRRHFHRFGPQHRLFADGSPSYLCDPETARRILSFDPEARFVVAVRNPVEMLASYHARLLYTLDEDVADLAEAWALQERRASGAYLPRRCREPLLLQYREVCSLAGQVERLFEVAGRSRCLVVVLDDVRRDPAQTYCALLDHLELKDDGRRDFRVARENSTFRRTWLQAVVMNPPPPFDRLAARWLREGMRYPEWMRRARRKLKKWNTSKSPRTEMPPALRAMLREAFAEDVERLGALIGRDLSAWR
jgi:hypothetical protein